MIDQVNVNVADNAVKNENVVLKKELNDLKTTYAMATVQFEELEIKNESLQKEIVSLDDKIEEAYHEVRNSKEDLSKLNIEKNKLIEMLDDRADRTSCIKEELEKTSRLYKEVVEANNGLEENIMMLENTLESRDQKAYELEEALKNLEESMPFSSSTVCDQCKQVNELGKYLTEHDIFKHSDEDLPSTSK